MIPEDISRYSGPNVFVHKGFVLKYRCWGNILSCEGVNTLVYETELVINTLVYEIELVINRFVYEQVRVSLVVFARWRSGPPGPVGAADAPAAAVTKAI